MGIYVYFIHLVLNYTRNYKDVVDNMLKQIEGRSERNRTQHGNPNATEYKYAGERGKFGTQEIRKYATERGNTIRKRGLPYAELQYAGSVRKLKGKSCTQCSGETKVIIRYFWHEDRAISGPSLAQPLARGQGHLWPSLVKMTIKWVCLWTFS